MSHVSPVQKAQKSEILLIQLQLPFGIVEVIIAQLHAHQIMSEHVKTV